MDHFRFSQQVAVIYTAGQGMTKPTPYGRYTIRSRPVDLTGPGFQRQGYKVRIDISWQITEAIGVVAECLQEKPLYQTESEADLAGLSFGRKLIDEGHFGKPH